MSDHDSGTGLRWYGEGRYEEAHAWFATELQLAEGEHGPDSDEAANLLFGMALCLRAMERYEEALPILERHQEIAEMVGTPSDVSAGCRVLGLTLMELKQPARANRYLGRMIAYRTSKAATDPPSAYHWYVAGCAAADIDDLELARARLIRATRHPKATGGMFDELARVQDRLELPEDALRSFETAIRRLQEDDSTVVFVVMRRAATSMFRFARMNDCMRLLDSLERWTRDTHGTDAEEYALVCGDLGHAYRNLGKLDEARTWYEQDLRISRRHLGEHAYTAVALDSIGGLLVAMGQVEDALPYLEEAVAIEEKVMERDSADRLFTLTKLEQALRTVGKTAEADSRREAIAELES